MTINQASIAEQKRTGKAGKFGSKSSTAPTGSLAPVRKGDDHLAALAAVWDGPAEQRQEAYDLAVASVVASSQDGGGLRGACVRHGGTEVMGDLRSDDSDDDVAGRTGIDASDVARIRKYLPDMDRRTLSALQVAAQKGIRLRTRAEGGVPARFDDLGDDRPLALWTKGNEGLLNSLDDSVRVTGSRASTAYGDHIATELVQKTSSQGKPLVTGLSYGIEGAAARTSMIAGTPVIAFTTGGVDRVYPAGHASLQKRVAESGLLVSAEAPGETPTRYRVLNSRNLAAAATPSNIVVEAGGKSGVLASARRAHEMGRNVYAVPGPITSAMSLGPNKLIGEGTAAPIYDINEMEL